MKSYFPIGTASRYDLAPCDHHLFGQSGTSMENKFAGRGGARLTRHRASSTNSWSRQTHNMYETQPAMYHPSKCREIYHRWMVPAWVLLPPPKKEVILHFGTWGFVKPMVKKGWGIQHKKSSKLERLFSLVRSVLTCAWFCTIICQAGGKVSENAWTAVVVTCSWSASCYPRPKSVIQSIFNFQSRHTFSKHPGQSNGVFVKHCLLRSASP